MCIRDRGWGGTAAANAVDDDGDDAADKRASTVDVQPRRRADVISDDCQRPLVLGPDHLPVDIQQSFHVLFV